MNSIYKVIWSKAKNCYVVASEIAKSHTKSASGQSVRRSALASLLALSLLCGGLGVASAALEVVNQSGTPGAVAIYTKDEVDLALAAKGAATDVATNKANIEANKTAINDLKAGDTALNQKIEAEQDARVEFDQALKEKIEAEQDARAEVDQALNEKIEAEMNARAEVDQALNEKIEANTTAIGGLTTKDSELEGKIQANKDAIDATNKRTDGIKYDDVRDETTIENNVTVDSIGNVTAKGQLTAQGGVNAGNSDIITTGEVNAGSLNVENASHLKGDVTMDNNLTVRGDTTLKGTKVDGKLAVTDDADLKNTKVDGTLGVTGATTLSGELTAEKDATFEKDVTVKGTTNLKDTTVDGDLKVAGTITTDKMVFGDKATNNYTEIDHGKVTSKNLEVNGAGETISSSSTFNAKENKVGFANSVTGEQSFHKQTSDVITDNVKNNITGDQSFHKQTSDIIMDNVKDLHNSNNRTQTKTETKDIITDKDGNSSTTSQTASENKTYLKDKGGKNTNSTIDTAKGYDKTIKGENGETSTKQDELNITNTAQNGTITNDAQNIVNNASGNITNKANTMDTNVTGKATESYGELETEVKGNEKHTVKGDQTNEVDGKQINTIKNGQENIISGGQTNTITGGQINNITGDQTTNVSGTQTTTATDINRNASSSMVDKVDNAYGTNTETKEAGKTTTDVSIKGTGEKGQYIRGANESRDYLIKGTLMNSETKTAEATSSEITDGTNTASTRQDAKNLAGSVTNGTETGISGIHANDDGSVSIDSAVAGGGMSSVINQKKDSIQSAVGDGTNSTVIHQDKDNVTIASSNGTVAIVGKDIVNNASESITNKAKTMDTTVTGKATESYGELDTTVTGQATENFNGGLNTKVTGAENHTVTGKQTNTVEGGQENIISGGQTNTITGGQINNITGDQTTTITGKKTETVEGKVTEKFNNGQETTVTGDQDIHVTKNQTNEIGGNQTTNVTGDISNTAKNITNEATGTLTDKVGDNTRVINGEGITDTVGGSNLKSRVTQKKGSIETVVTDGTSFNQSRDIPVASTKTLTGYGKMNQLLDDLNSSTKTITDGTHKTSKVQTALDITNTAKDGTITNDAKDIVNNAQDTITNTAGTKITDTAGDSTVTTENGKGTTFTKTGSTAYREGGPTDTNISGNTITTGKVTMDYADVMRDLGVGGNANIAGTTTTKTLNVTEDASVGRDLSVGGNATIAGDVTARSYKVDGKTYIDANGINANNQKITNVADGSISEGSKDAVNGGQLYGVKRDLEHQVDKVGANAAAMANLRPMEFDPSSKWNIAAAIGNYGSETAAAIGAFYRPNDNVMVNLSTAFGTGENMVGGGVSVRLGKGGNKLSREETNALKAQVADLTARMDALLSVLNPNMSKDFPDVPENHWAYEAVSRLAGNDIVQGYPDGEFHGERTMTRYEMAEIIYNALSRGAEAERKLVEEFKPELQAMAASEKSTAEKAEG